MSLTHVEPPAAAEPQITFEGGDWATPETAVVVRGAFHDLVGTIVVHHYLAWRFGRPNIDWQLLSLASGSPGPLHIDTYKVKLATGEMHTLYFDLTESFGKSLRPAID